MKKMTLILTITLMVFSFVSHGPWMQNACASEKKFEMRLQSLFPRGDLSTDLLEVFADAAEKYSDGRIAISVFAEPEIVPGDQLFGATRRNVVDMLHGMGGMWAGSVPVGDVEFNLPLAYRIDEADTFEEKAQVVRDFIFESGFADILREEYAKHGLYFLDIHTYGPVPFVLSTEPVHTCDDLRGMVIKADGINRTFHAKVGMHGADVSPTEAYMALRLGTVDAAEWDVSAVTGLNWHEVAPYWIRGMECDHTTGHILINMKKWEQLSDTLKDAMHAAAEDYWHATVEGYKEEIETVRALVEKGEIEEIMLDEACRQQYREAAFEIWDELSKQDPASAEAISLIRKWRQME